MRLRVYEQLYTVNWHLVEAARDLQALARTLKLDKTAVQLMVSQIDEVRRDANGSLANQINDRELIRARKHPTRNWRLDELRRKPSCPGGVAQSWVRPAMPDSLRPSSS